MPKTKDPALMERFRAACKEVYEDDKLADYCVSKAAEVVELSNGLMVDIDKKKVRTRFCFGYSDMGFGPTYDEAYREMRSATASEGFFLRENMEEYDRVLQNLSNHGRDVMVVLSGNTEHLRGLSLWRTTQLLEAVGGSAFIPALKGKELEYRGIKRYVCTDEDVKLIRDAYERARDAHMKKCRAYLKRYGLSKISTWTYWMDD